MTLNHSSVGYSCFDQNSLLIDKTNLTACNDLLKKAKNSNLKNNNNPLNSFEDIPVNYHQIQGELIHVQGELEESHKKFQYQSEQLLQQINSIQNARAVMPVDYNSMHVTRTTSLGDSKRNRSNQTQKMSSTPRSYDRNSQGGSGTVHSERSIRANKRNELQATGNPLDIWVRSAPFFQPLPTAEEIDDICREITFERRNGQNHPKIHWSEKMNQIVALSQRESSRKERTKQLLPLPRPPPAPSDVSEFWRGITPTFPMADLQRNNNSIVHCLLCAFVEAEPESSDDDEGENNEKLPNDDNQGNFQNSNENDHENNDENDAISETGKLCKFLSLSNSESNEIQNNSNHSENHDSRNNKSKSDNHENNRSSIPENHLGNNLENTNHDNDYHERHKNKYVDSASGPDADFNHSNGELYRKICEHVKKQKLLNQNARRLKQKQLELANEDNALLVTHAPIPQVEFDDYLCRSFEERLEIELKCAGLEKPSGTGDNFNSVFTQEIEQYRVELNALQPQIEAMRDEIKNNLVEYRIDEERRMVEQQDYLNYIREVKKKTHKK
ncbi:hypothetical protein TRFO_25264 [Tritrichomonas foetus]|uniref:Uncharacterized protein n=1 Tax=Tritrichomonas foetus TaxID=1144522 RepID=A0A1J4K6P8_9EUKA|nr:hypothetical protein TRFO_25264 [Tritrichomonas foetus]|eukprot:OHT06650.1 hypothetical protein TRFO_25264 [Tritrichomonas foetus]